MTAQTHIAGGVAAGLVTVYINRAVGGETASGAVCAVCISLAVIGSLAPDIDLKTSKAGQKFKVASTLLNAFFGHRTICHSPLFWGLLYRWGLANFGAYSLYLQAGLLGVISHLLLDMLNSTGVPLLYPIPYRFSFAKIHTGGMGEKLFGTLLAAVDVWGLVQVM